MMMMVALVPTRRPERNPRGDARGQSLVEFGLVLPLLLILLLGIADFGRIFAQGIATEAAVRNAAEATAQEYLQLLPGPLVEADYDRLHAVAADIACREADALPGRVLDGSGGCAMPIIAVCIHDGVDGNCGSASGPPPAECTRMAEAWSPAQLTTKPYVEVRMCYRFDPLITVPLGDWGAVWLQKENNFTVADY